jgi:hypothetical protein
VLPSNRRRQKWLKLTPYVSRVSVNKLFGVDPARPGRLNRVKGRVHATCARPGLGWGGGRRVGFAFWGVLRHGVWLVAEMCVCGTGTGTYCDDDRAAESDG